MAAEYRRLYGAEPRFDAIGVHIYSSDPAKMRQYITARHAEWPTKLMWITEFNGCYERNNPALMTTMMAWFNSQTYIARYAWFVSRPDMNPDTESPCTLMLKSGQLTQAGEMYRLKN